MSEEEVRATAAELFKHHFSAAPASMGYAPGRVNLLGEHTDYNGGLVMPMPLTLGTAVALGPGTQPNRILVVSDSFDGKVTLSLQDKASGRWSDYVLGCLAEAFGRDAPATGLHVAIASDLPVGSGLSSSAAIEVATLHAANDMLGGSQDPMETARTAKKVENDFVGMPCGIMDQFAVAVGSPGHALYLDTHSLEHKDAPLDAAFSFVVVHSGVRHRLTDGGYKQRVEECTAACQALGVPYLSALGIDNLARTESLDALHAARARHVITENHRVRTGYQALIDGNFDVFAEQMIASHASQRDDYEVSVPEVDQLVQGALAAGAIGARLTGGGFGGSIVALVKREQLTDWCVEIARKFPNSKILAAS